VAAWNVECRRLDLGGGWPECRDDVLAAIDLLAEDDAPLDLAEGVAVVGHSAGGHLALLAGAERPHPGTGGTERRPLGVARVVAQGAVTDLEAGAALGLGDGVVARFSEGVPLDAASPIRRAPLDVPVLLIHGADDDVVPASMSEDFAAKGGDVTLSIRPGEGHFEHTDPSSGAWKEAVAWLAS
jgi:pimeloyl-ACP methyl ester carboxylesterase